MLAWLCRRPHDHVLSVYAHISDDIVGVLRIDVLRCFRADHNFCGPVWLVEWSRRVVKKDVNGRHVITQGILAAFSAANGPSMLSEARGAHSLAATDVERLTHAKRFVYRVGQKTYSLRILGSEFNVWRVAAGWWTRQLKPARGR